MNRFFSRFNPAERRLIIYAGIVLFGIVNFLWVFPRFSDWSALRGRLDGARVKYTTYKETIEQASKLKLDLARLKGEGGDVLPEDQSLQFLRTIQNQANASGVGVNNYGKQTTSTNNPFFLEMSQTISVLSPEKPLVDFFHNLGAGNSMIRVRSLSIHPDAPRQQLAGTITLIASYQKNPRTQPAPKPVTATPPTVKPTVVKPATPAPTPGPPSGPTPAAPRKPVIPKAPTPNKK